MTSTETIIHLSSKQQQAPSPADYTIPTKFGLESPRYTIRPRPEMKTQGNRAGYDYNPNTIGTGRKVPIGVRPKEREKEVTPGPSYMPPAFGQDTPRVALHGKMVNNERGFGVESPGPGKYDTNTTSRSPRWVIGHRQFEQGKIFGPGPGKYNPDYDRVMSSAPKTGIRVKTAGAKQQITPGPYDVPHQLDTHGSVFHRRAKELTSKDNFPGPGKYSIPEKFGQESPRYTIRPRNEEKQNVIGAPYQKLPDITGNTSPKYSFSIRPKDRDIQATPGPNYSPPPFAHDSIRYSFPHKSTTKVQSSGPGPGKYNTRDESLTGPKYTMKARKFNENEGKVLGPGPGKYLPDYEKVLPSPPKTGIRVKTDGEKPAPQTPGYIAAPPVPSGPKFTIGVKDPNGIAPGSV